MKFNKAMVKMLEDDVTYAGDCPEFPDDAAGCDNANAKNGGK